MKETNYGHLLALAPFPYYGGLQEYAIELACRLRMPIVLVGNPSFMPNDVAYRIEKCGVETIWIRSDKVLFRVPMLFKLSLYEQIRKFLKQYSLVHFHGPYPLVGDIILRKLKYIFTYHFDIALRNVAANLVAKLYTSTLLYKTLRQAKVITSSSKYFVQDSPVLRRFRYKSKVLPLGIDIEKYIPRFKYTEKIVFMGRLIPEKGIHVLIEAFRIFSQRNPEYKLIIIGKPVDVGYWKYLMSLVKKYNLNDKVVFTGYLSKDKALQILSESSACVLPSLSRLDSFGIVLLEASALAIPVIATTIIPGARELIENARNGLLVRPNDAKDLARALEEVVKNPQVYGLRGRHYVVQHHSWEVVIAKAEQIFREALEIL